MTEPAANPPLEPIHAPHSQAEIDRLHDKLMRMQVEFTKLQIKRDMPEQLVVARLDVLEAKILAALKTIESLLGVRHG